MAAIYQGETTVAVSSGTAAINFNDGSNAINIQLVNGAQSITFSNPGGGENAGAGLIFTLRLIQPSSGAAGTVSWPVNVKWAGGSAPVLTTTNSKQDLIGFYYDGTNYNDIRISLNH